jgi:hypothetical protein
MKSDRAARAGTTRRQKNCMEISLQAIPSKLRVAGGKEISFRRAILSMHNTGQKALVGIVPHATLAQEGGAGSVYDGTEALSRAKTVESIPPGEAINWDVYDLLLNAHPGVAGKVHLWGYKAILDWWLELTVWVEYRTKDVATPLNTPISRWRLRWSPLKTSPDEVDLSIELWKDGGKGWTATG